MRSRNADYYEKIAEPLDLSTIEKQLLTGCYKTVEAFDADMLKVFRNAEVAPSASADRALPGLPPPLSVVLSKCPQPKGYGRLNIVGSRVVET